MNCSIIKVMKHILLSLLLLCGVLTVEAQTNATWEAISDTSRWFSQNRAVLPVIFYVDGKHGESCDLGGLFVSGKMLMALKGEAWLRDGSVFIKLKGTADDGMDIMVYGQLSKIEDFYLKFKGHYAITINGRGREFETSVVFAHVSVIKAAEEEKSRQEEAMRRQKIEAFKSSVEYRLFKTYKELLQSGTLYKKEGGFAMQTLRNIASENGISTSMTEGRKNYALRGRTDKTKECEVNNTSIKLMFKKLPPMEITIANAFRYRSDNAEEITILADEGFGAKVYYIKNATGKNFAFAQIDNKFYQIDDTSTRAFGLWAEQIPVTLKYNDNGLMMPDDK